jgi:RNA polymerase sigma factor (sigma-70 family)
MLANPFRFALHSIRQRLGLEAAGASPDALLLDRFVQAGDEKAFTALVERHGALVWDVCRRVAGDAHAAEDAFQATWIVLFRKARTLRDGGFLAGWLHRVAYRLSLTARARRAAPLEDAPVDAPGPEDEVSLREVRRVIDEEVSRLPEKYRLPVVLCFLEGRTHAEAAAELDWPIGTVAGRVARAKDLLHARLSRRGLSPSALVLPLAAAGAFPAVAGKAAGAGAVSLAGALLAREARRRRLVGAAVLLLCAGGVAGIAVYRATSPSGIESDRALPGISPAARIPRTRIQVDGAVVLSPDGTWLAGCRDGRIRQFNVRTNEEVRALAGKVPEPPRSLLFSPDQKWLAATGGGNSQEGGGSDGWVMVWDLASGEGKTLTELPKRAPTTYIPFWTGEHSLVGFVPKTNQLITALGDETHLSDVHSEKRLRSFQGTGPLSPDGKTLATWDPKAKTTRLWEVASGKELFNLDPVGGAIFHPDSETLATLGRLPRKVGEDAFIHFWDRKTGKLHGTLDPYTAVVPGLNWERLLQELHNRGRGETLESWLRSYNIGPRSFSPDGEVLACWFQEGDGNPRAEWTLLWSVRSGRFLIKLEGAFRSFSPDSKRIATEVKVELPPGAKPDILNPNERMRPVTRLWDVASGKQVLDLAGASSFPEPKFFPDGKTMYSGPRFWDAQTGREQGVFNGYCGGGLAFSLDGETLVSVSDEKATLWNMATAVKTDVPGKATVAPEGKSVAFEKGAPIRLHSPLPLSLPLSKKEFDDVREALSSKDLEDVLKARSARIRQFPHPTIRLRSRTVPRRLVVGPDGKLRVELARVGDWWDDNSSTVERAEGEARREGGPEGKYDGVRAAAFSADGKYLALGRESGTIQLWDISPSR